MIILVFLNFVLNKNVLIMVVNVPIEQQTLGSNGSTQPRSQGLLS